jgi:DNA-binding NarL/FixJ family response regulator
VRYAPTVPSQRPVHVLLVGEDSSLRDSLFGALESDDSIGTVRAVGHGGSTCHQDLPDPDVILFDAGPPAPNLAAMDGDTTPEESLVFVLASDMSEETCELAEAVGAVGYLKRDSEVAGIAPIVVALARLCSTPRPVSTQRPS